MASTAALDPFPEPFATESRKHLDAIQNAPTRHELVDALDTALSYLRDQQNREELTVAQTILLGRLWSFAVDDRLRELSDA